MADVGYLFIDTSVRILKARETTKGIKEKRNIEEIDREIEVELIRIKDKLTKGKVIEDKVIEDKVIEDE